MDSMQRWIMEQQKWSDAPAVLRSSLEALVLPPVTDVGLIVETARQAVDAACPNPSEKQTELATLLAALPEDRCILLGAQWLATSCVYLHLLIPEVLRARPASQRFAEQVFDWGISYPDPSLNRPFVEVAIEQLGRERAVVSLLAKTDGIASAYYWMSAGVISRTDRLLRRRLKPFARYLVRWWHLW